MSLKVKVDGVNVNKLETVPINLNKFGNVVKNHVVKSTICDEMVKKIDAIQDIDTSNLVKKLSIIQK